MGFEWVAARRYTAAMYSTPLGYFITWTCYGTWLHGDERGSVRREFRSTSNHEVMSDPALLDVMRRKMSQPAYVMDEVAREVVDQTIREVCEYRGWIVHALNVRTNHVHVVVRADSDPTKVLGDLKSWATRRLREGGVVDETRKVWSDGGSTRYLWDEEGLRGAVHYTDHRQ